MKNILVTGGCGFIGSHFIKHLFDKYSYTYRIFNVDCLTYAGNLENIRETEHRRNYKFFKANIADEEVYDIIKDCKIDTIVSYAASTHVDRSIRNPKEFLDTDVIGSFNLAHASLKYGIRRYLHISSDEVYGSMVRSDFEASEVTPINPTSPYAASKAAGDVLLMSYYRTYELPLLIARPCNTYGSHQYPEKLIPLTITRLLEGKKALVHGEGKEEREWIYVSDLCRAIDCVLHLGKIGSVYNIGSGFRLPNVEVTTKIIKFMQLHIEDSIEYMNNRPGNDVAYRLISNRMKKLYGGDYATTPFDTGLLRTIAWYRQHRTHWNEINIDSNIYKSNEDYLR